MRPSGSLSIAISRHRPRGVQRRAQVRRWSPGSTRRTRRAPPRHRRSSPSPSPSPMPPDTDPVPDPGGRPLDHVRSGSDDLPGPSRPGRRPDPAGWPVRVDGPCPGLRPRRTVWPTSPAPRAMARRSMSSAWTDSPRTGGPRRSMGTSRASAWNDLSIGCGVERSPIERGPGGSIYVAISTGAVANIHVVRLATAIPSRMAAADPRRSTRTDGCGGDGCRGFALHADGVVAWGYEDIEPAIELEARRTEFTSWSFDGQLHAGWPRGSAGAASGRSSMSTTASPTSARPDACGATMTAGRSGRDGRTSWTNRRHRTSPRTDASPSSRPRSRRERSPRPAPARRNAGHRRADRPARGHRDALPVRGHALRRHDEPGVRERRDDVPLACFDARMSSETGRPWVGWVVRSLRSMQTAPSSMDGRSISPNGRTCWICPWNPTTASSPAATSATTSSATGRRPGPRHSSSRPTATLIEQTFED